MRSIKGAAFALSTLAAGALLAGCAADPGSADRSLSCTNTILKPDAEQVLLWAWYPAFDSVVDAFNEANDDVQVCWNNVGVNIDEYTKLNTAIEAGTGGPDVVMIESAIIPSYTIQNALVELGQYGASELEDDYTPGSWSDVSNSQGVYGIPQDGGPMGLLYRQDVFEQYGVAVPTTWDEFADAAQALRDAGYEGYITNFPLNGKAFIQAMFAQAGAVPYVFDPDNPAEVGIYIDSPEVVQVLAYWQDLIDRDLVSHNDRTTAEDNARLLDGTYAASLAAAWGPGYLQGLTEGGVPDGEWRAAPLPQWEADNPIQVNWGGSAFAVTTQAPNPELAATVAMEIFGTPERWQIGIDEASLFPLYRPVLESPDFADKPYEFFGGQQINRDVFLDAAAGYEGFVNTPFQNFVYDKTNESLARMVSGELTPQETAEELQSVLAEYATQQGFTLLD